MQEEEFRSTSHPIIRGKAPAMKVKLLSDSGGVKTYMVIFSKEDELLSGLTDFAFNYDVKSAYFHGIGSAFGLELGWFDFDRLQYQVIPIGIAEVTSFTGNITWMDTTPVVHAHATAALRGGSVKGGHVLSINVGPTFEVIVVAQPTALYKKLNQEFQAGMII